MIIKKGLWKAAESAGCWIVTEGFNLGIMKLAGDAVRDYTDAYGGNKMVAVGVAPWNCVAKNEILENAIDQGTNPAIYQSEEEAAVSDEEEKQMISREKSLDTNHSYFLLTDSSSAENSFDQDLQFRTRFEHAISSWKSTNSLEGANSEIRIPICGLVVGGDIYTLRQVCNSIIVNKCPIVACQGTSGSADVFALGLSVSLKFAIEESPDDPDIVPLDARLELILRECIQKMNPEISNYTEDVKLLLHIFTELSFLISVFDMDEDWDLDGYIISSLLSSAGSEVAANQLNLEQLEITLTLNRADIAKEKIFLENKKWKKGDLNEYMFNALMSDRHEFVKLFLEQGFSLEDFLTIHTLEKLYTDQLKNMDSRISIFQQLWNNHKIHKSVKLKEVGKVIKVLVGDFYHPLYLSKDFQSLYFRPLNTDSNVTSVVQKNNESVTNPQIDHSYENKGLEEDSNEHKSTNRTIPESHSTKSTNSVINLKQRPNDVSWDSSSFSDIVYGKKHLLRRISSLDLINLTTQSKTIDDGTNDSKIIGTNLSEDNSKVFKNNKYTKANNNKILLRRTSSLDFIKTDSKSVSSTTTSKKALLQRRDEKTNNQINIDDIDVNKLKEINLERPARELMIWSLLMGKLQMTELFWTIEKEPIAGALLSSILLSALANKTDDFTDKEDYIACAKRFEEQAEGVLNECYVEDEIRAQMLINKQLQYYGNSSVILLAAEGESIKFMAHPCCQDFLTSTWYGELSSKTSILRILVGVFVGMTLPFLLPKIVKYKLTDSNKDRDDKLLASKNDEYKNTDMDDVEKGKSKINILGPAKLQIYSTKQSRRSRSFVINYILKIKGFYFAPIIRFAYSALSYIMFLVLFSVYLMYRFTVSFTNEELVIIFWVGTLLIDEIKQSALSGISLKTYFADGWNKLDCMAITLFSTGFILRLITYITRNSDLTSLNAEFFIILTDPRFIVAQVLISFSLFFFYVRLIYFFSIHIALGPKLIMIRKMISNDLIPFMIILMVFTIGYGVTAISIGFPLALQFTDQWLTNTSVQLQQKDVGSTIMQLLISSYFAMFGEFGLDGLRATGQYCDLTQPNYVPTPMSRIIVPIFLAVYVLLTNILLFNLLIAMFTKTYEEIEASSLYYWNFQRYQMVSEFNYRSPFAPPFIILWNFYELYYYFKGKLKTTKLGHVALHNNPFCISLEDDSKKKRELTKWEHMKAMDFLRNLNEPTHTSRQNRANDGRSMVFRGGGGAGSGSSNPAAANPLAVQAADTKADISGIVEEMNHQLDKRFKEVDAKLVKLSDIETQISVVLDTVKTLDDHMDNVRTFQNELMTRIDNFPKCQCTEVVNIKQSENESAEEVTKLEIAIKTAILALKDEFKPLIVDLMKISTKEIEKKLPEDKELEVIFTITDDIGDVNNDVFFMPDVDDPTTGRIIERIVNNHRMWRYIPFNFEKYPGMRMKVPNNVVSWQVPYSDYNAYDASEEELLYPNETCHDGSDPLKYKEQFNSFDSVNKLKRQSMLGQYAIDAQSNAPLNPTGRTGLKGRGLLPHWGPNHSITTLFTRWSRNEQGLIVQKNNKPMLQYIALERTKRFGIPWFLVDHTPVCDINECSIKTVMSYLEQRLRALFSTRKTEFILKNLLAANCFQTFKGFLDDHLNADNAWVETVVINFHETEKFLFTDDLLRIFTEKNSPETVKWLDLTHSVNLRASHDIILKTVAHKANSFF